jgi:hypothetical protein
MTIWFSRRARPGKSSIRAGGRCYIDGCGRSQGHPRQHIDAGRVGGRDALKKGARLASVGTMETVLYQALRGWLQNVTK